MHGAMYVMIGPMLCGHCTRQFRSCRLFPEARDETHVGAVAIQPQKLKLTSRVRIRNEGSFLCVLATVQVYIGGTLDGCDVIYLADYGRRWFSVGYISSVSRAIDGDLRDITMCAHLRQICKEGD